MEHAELTDSPIQASTAESRFAAGFAADRNDGVRMAHSEKAPCPSCEAAANGPEAAPAFVYALGRIEARFPRAAVEKEFAQATARADTAGKTDREAFHAVLAARENRYLARQMCWVFSVQGLEAYLLRPRDPADWDLLIDAIGGPAEPLPWMSLVVGLRGPVAAPQMCNGLAVPIVAFDQLYSFDHASLMSAIPRPEKSTDDAPFASAAEELFARVMQLTDNAGASDEHRALNYLAMRYPAIYANAADCHARDYSLKSVDVRPSTLSTTRSIVDVVFSYANRNTDFTEKFFVRVDVTEEFPFLVTKLAPYFDR
jgi:PatG C-terminal